MKKERIKIFLIDDDVLYFESLQNLFRSNERLNLIYQTANFRELSNILLTSQPDILLLNIRSAHYQAENITSLLHANFPEIKIIAISKKLEEILNSKLFIFDANAYLTKKDSSEQIIQTILKVKKEGYYYGESFIRFMRNHHVKKKIIHQKKESNTLFTKRELQVLELVCLQKTTQEISEELYVSPRTVEGHRNSMMVKTGSKNVAGLIVYAFQHNLIDIKESLIF
ncbi:LuxR C-terminal-related transcriptional regulator [Flavicella sediminum]|uniref:LuxR C-terminal-related transcriptional regulator n=1 Tax=Flavicella sediminum TaxID=2585141 RepID=UPI00112455F4|nr:response regulator transcription factor [Flavicella sediminum]